MPRSAHAPNTASSPNQSSEPLQRSRISKRRRAPRKLGVNAPERLKCNPREAQASSPNNSVSSKADERRTLRSEEPSIALGRLLDAARALGNAQAVALADTSGVLIAGAGYFRECEELAAISAYMSAPTLNPPGARSAPPLTVQTPQSSRANSSPGLPESKITPQIRQLHIDGTPLLLASQGGDSEATLKYAEAGARRILGDMTQIPWLWF